MRMTSDEAVAYHGSVCRSPASSVEVAQDPRSVVGRLSRRAGQRKNARGAAQQLSLVPHARFLADSFQLLRSTFRAHTHHQQPHHAIALQPRWESARRVSSALVALGSGEGLTDMYLHSRGDHAGDEQVSFWRCSGCGRASSSSRGASSAVRVSRSGWNNSLTIFPRSQDAEEQGELAAAVSNPLVRLQSRSLVHLSRRTREGRT